MKIRLPDLPTKSGLRIAHFSDIHLGKITSPPHAWVFKTWLNLAQILDIDVFVVSGDLVHEPNDIKHFDLFEKMMGERDVLVVPGNHDVLNPHDAQIFTDRFGEFPRSETRQGVEFLLFDSHAGLTLDEREADELERYHEGRSLKHGRITPDQVQLFSTPKAAQRIAVLHHHPERHVHDGMMPLKNTDEFLDWCVASDVSAVLYGHVHDPHPVWDERGVMMLRGSASGKLPSMIRLIDFPENGAIKIHEISAS